MTVDGFEGPEKLLEIWFQFDNKSTSNPSGLRVIEYDTWARVLSLVKCDILSVKRNDFFDAYLLSESSMFVYPHKLTLKTCGTTTLLKCLARLLEIAAKSPGISGNIEYVFYSRKQFMFPDRQIYPHTNWSDEVSYLEKYFSGGSAYTVGKTNGDHWFCFVWEEPLNPLPQLPSGQIKVDCTLEVLMSGLDEEWASKMFYKKANSSPSDNEFSGLLKRAFPDSDIDEFHFDPCGYSCNGLKDEYYFTIHVTPEPKCSYASFETNMAFDADMYAKIVRDMVHLFKPSNFTVTLFSERANCDSSDNNETHKYLWTGPSKSFCGFFRQDKIIYEFENYDLLFAHYECSEKLRKKRQALQGQNYLNIKDFKIKKI